MSQQPWAIDKAVKVARKAWVKAAREFMEAKVLTPAIDATPVESGTLRRSGTVTVGALPEPGQVYEAAKSDGQRTGYRANLGEEPVVFVSFNTPYAEVQHENMEFKHPLGGGPKYLENAYKASIGQAAAYIEPRVKRALEEAK